MKKNNPPGKRTSNASALEDLKKLAIQLLSTFIRASGSTESGINMDAAFVEKLKPLFEFLYHIYFRVQVKGAENIPERGAAILVPNHSGALPYDGAMINLAVFNEHPKNRHTRFLVDDFVYRIPMLANFIQRIGGVKATYENAEALLKARELVAIFPEGVDGIGKSYDERYMLRSFGRGGFIRLAMSSKAPIIPVAVIGAEDIHPIIWKSKLLAQPLGIPFIPFTPTFPWLGPLGLIPLPSRWTIVFGKPIHIDGSKKSRISDDKSIAYESEKVRRVVQRMIDRELAKRKSIWI